ncbi:MAG: hypothetical protein HC810_02040, partial [Acaryochloridaceae cyanobacterium RL_2_7]|nr:hypothetical protein [Acaryochloridaceae cyanobacterium RL_2_7]
MQRTQSELKAQNQELDQFTYIVSHDLKAPLRGISNLSEWIAEDLETVLTDETRHELALLRDRVQRMEKMIQGLLEYSRVGRANMQNHEVNVQELLTECIDSLDPPSAMQIQVGDNMPTFETTGVLLRQVFMNLIGNAIKHHHQEMGLIQVSVLERDNRYEFEVSDNGPGISPTD